MKKLEFDFDNVPGIDFAFAIPVTSFKRIRNDYTLGSRALEVRNREDIIQLESYNDRFSFQEKKSLADGGDVWDVTLKIVVPKLFAPNEELVHQLERNVWLILFRDKNGNILLSGTTDIPLSCSSTKTTDSGVELIFSAKEQNPSIFVSTDVG